MVDYRGMVKVTGSRKGSSLEKVSPPPIPHLVCTYSLSREQLHFQWIVCHSLLSQNYKSHSSFSGFLGHISQLSSQSSKQCKIAPFLVKILETKGHSISSFYSRFLIQKTASNQKAIPFLIPIPEISSNLPKMLQVVVSQALVIYIPVSLLLI